MIDLIIWWVGAVVIFIASFCMILFVVGFVIQAILNYFWRKITRAKGMVYLQKASSFYEKYKDSTND